MMNSVVFVSDLRVGGHMVTTDLSDSYDGLCAVVSASSSPGGVIAVAERDVAFRIAYYAVSPDGGYGAVHVTDCNNQKITCKNFLDFI